MLSGEPKKKTHTCCSKSTPQQPSPRNRFHGYKGRLTCLFADLPNILTALGETKWLEFKTHGPIVGSKTDAGFGFVLTHLFAVGLVVGNHTRTLGGSGQAHAALSFAGWEHYESLRQGSVVYRKAVMAMKFGVPELGSMLEQVFRPSAKAAGFDLFKLDDAPRAGLIDDRLRVEIQASDFLIADLTHDNLGAYWAAGYGEDLESP
jgi:hypothetical protein